MFACVCMYVMYVRDKTRSYCGKLSSTPLSGQVVKNSYLKIKNTNYALSLLLLLSQAKCLAVACITLFQNFDSQ